MRFAEVTLAAPAARLAELDEFYAGTLGLSRTGHGAGWYEVGETRLRFEAAPGEPFYHFALLVPGDRFDAAHAWAAERVELAGGVFDFDAWDARACYLHDPAGSIVELIALRGIAESGADGPFAGGELAGVSELGLVGDPRSLLEPLASELAIELWDGLEDDGDLAFAGERGRTLILAPEGRGWLPTRRPAEPHPVAARVRSPRRGRLELDGGRYRIEGT